MTAQTGIETRPQLLWFGLAAAFSPVLFQMVRTLPELPFGFSVLVAPVLAYRLNPRVPEGTRLRSSTALWLVALGLVLELIGLAGASRSIAQLGIPIAVVGVAALTRVPRLETSLLAFWAIPLPSFLFLFTTPHVETAFAQAAIGVLEAVGLHFQASGPLVRDSGQVLEFVQSDSGLQLAAVLALLGYYTALTFGVKLGRALALAAAATLLAVPGQFVAAMLAIVFLPLYGEPVAAAWLANGAWLSVVIPTVCAVEWLARRR